MYDHARDAHHTISTGCKTYELWFPSWSWRSTSLGIFFADQCALRCSEVKWHKPSQVEDGILVAWFKFTISRKFSNDHEDWPNTEAKSESIFGELIIDYGLLRGTA